MVSLVCYFLKKYKCWRKQSTSVNSKSVKSQVIHPCFECLLNIKIFLYTMQMCIEIKVRISLKRLKEKNINVENNSGITLHSSLLFA